LTFGQGPAPGDFFVTNKRRPRADLRALCGEIREDDGVDPRDFFKAGKPRRKQDHKAEQLCRQVAETLDQVLAGETGDDLLRLLHVVSVRPAPDASRFAVFVSADCPLTDAEQQQTQARLQAWAGRLRTLVTAAITRRRAPLLSFVLVDSDRSGGRS